MLPLRSAGKPARRRPLPKKMYVRRCDSVKKFALETESLRFSAKNDLNKTTMGVVGKGKKYYIKRSTLIGSVMAH